MKKILLSILYIVLSSVGYCQTNLNKQICFHFIDLYGSIVKPGSVEIIDSQGNCFLLSEDYCFDFPINIAYGFDIRVCDIHHYYFEKGYRFLEDNVHDTIKLENIQSMTKFFIKSDKPTLTDDEIAFLIKTFSEKHYGYSSLSITITVGKYDVSEFKGTIVQIYDLYVRDLLYRNLHNQIDFSVGFKKDDSGEVYYLFEGHGTH